MSTHLKKNCPFSDSSMSGNGQSACRNEGFGTENENGYDKTPTGYCIVEQ